MKQRVTTAKKALELVEQKASEAQGKLGETKLKLVENASILSGRNKEFTDYKGGEKAWKKTYNMGFRDAENSAGPMIFQARKFGFMEGWMAAVTTIGLPKEPLPNNPPADQGALALTPLTTDTPGA